DGRKPRLLHGPGARDVPGVGEHRHARSGVQLPERVRLLSWTGLHDSSWLMAGGACADLIQGNLPRVVNTCEVSHASCSRGAVPRPARTRHIACHPDGAKIVRVAVQTLLRRKYEERDTDCAGAVVRACRLLRLQYRNGELRAYRGRARRD